MPVPELLWQSDLAAAVQCNGRNSTSFVCAAALLFSRSTKHEHKNAQLKTCSPSAVLLLFLLANAAAPALVSSEPSAELLLITLSSSFFPASSVTVAASSPSSSSWSEYWLKASTSSLKISSLINPPSRTQSTGQNTCQAYRNANINQWNKVTCAAWHREKTTYEARVWEMGRRDTFTILRVYLVFLAG